MTETTEQTAQPTEGHRFAIDQSLCSGHGRCYTLAPQWFDSDDIGYGVAKDVVVPGDEQAEMDTIVAACPEGAIAITTGSSGSHAVG